MTISDNLIKDAESGLAQVVSKLKQDIGGIRGNRPSPDMIQDLKVNWYDQALTIRELGSLSVLPPRTIQVTVWDKDAMGPVMKAIEDAHMGLSVNSDGNTIRATLSPLGDERREEMARLIKKMVEAARIQIRGKREEAIKQLKAAESKKEATEDESFQAKEKIQKIVDRANKDAETMMEGKLAEFGIMG